MRERNENRNRKQKGGRDMRLQKKAFPINAWEKMRGYATVMLGDQGYFVADYVIPEDRKVFGFWYVKKGANPVWASITFEPADLSAEVEQYWMEDEFTMASNWLQAEWKSWTVQKENEEERIPIREM